jgi:TPP-dependent pyruvate/acetoin dehydrogenase alpha subunit
MIDDLLLHAYREMCRIRTFETRLNDLFLEGVIAGTSHFCIGQEACAVGVCMGLEPDDVVFSNHRGHGHLLARGADPVRIMAEIFGKPHGYSGGRGGSQHVAVKEINFMGTHGITAGTIPLAVGAALHKRLQDEPGLGVVFFGEGATGEGIFHESLNMAAIWSLPVLFVCENNQYAMSTAHQDISPVPNASDRAAAYAMTAEITDGNDVAAVYEATSRLRKQLIAGDGPAFLELQTYRVSGHSRGDQCQYRSREEEAEWQGRDPVDRARAQLLGSGIWSNELETEFVGELDADAALAEKAARNP